MVRWHAHCPAPTRAPAPGRGLPPRTEGRPGRGGGRRVVVGTGLAAVVTDTRQQVEEPARPPLSVAT
ncbi:hypothetical protein QJS66_22315 [Kocuria rhizophila]|nr:hypothetical protein QJS66_22315 [Kocuria rhizophila]